MTQSFHTPAIWLVLAAFVVYVHSRQKALGRSLLVQGQGGFCLVVFFLFLCVCLSIHLLSKLKVVVMSASLSAGCFSRYFNQNFVSSSSSSSSCPDRRTRNSSCSSFPPSSLGRASPSSRFSVASHPPSRVFTLKVPGRTFPVSVFYADHVRKCLGGDSSCSFSSSSSRAVGGHETTGSDGRGLTDTLEEEDEKKENLQGEGLISESVYGVGTRRNVSQHKHWEEEEARSVEGTWAVATSSRNHRDGAGEGASMLICHPRELPRRIAALVKYLHLNKPMKKTSYSYDNREGRKQGGGERGRERAAREGQEEEEEGGSGQEGEGGGGAILVFVSGVGEVSAVCRAIEDLQLHDLWILPCHASLHPKQQQKVRKTRAKSLLSFFLDMIHSAGSLLCLRLQSHTALFLPPSPERVVLRNGGWPL